jgi:RimJ/RimL family protein N-acetyltransferase
MNTLGSFPGPAYKILTPRLLIRCLEPIDAAMLNIAMEESLDHLLPWMPWAKQEPLAFQERIQYLRKCRGKFDLGSDFVYGIFNPDESKLLGGTGLHTRLGDGVREIGYWIHKDFISQGLATESSAALTRVAFEVDHVQRVEIHCDPKNVRSASVPRKLGYVHEATLHDRNEDTNGHLRDSMIWTLFAEDYPASEAIKIQVEAYDAIGRRII